MRTYIKHLVECICSLPQFKTSTHKLFHKFVVFSELDENTGFIPSVVECNNCGVAHKVTEVGRSTRMLDNIGLTVTKQDLKVGLPEKLVGVLELYRCELPTWQEARFITDNELWGRGFILTKETTRDGSTVGKTLMMYSPTKLKIETFVEEQTT